MTPRPQDPQSNSPLRLPRLAPVAAPVSVGRPVSQSQLQTANQFAGLSQSLAKSLVNIKRINEKDDDIAGAAAFHSGEDVDETTKSKKFLSGMHHASAVSQANKDIIGLKAHLDDYAAGDGQYTFDPETGDVVGLTDYGQMALDFIAPLRPENRKGDVYAATWGPLVNDAVSEVTEKHMNLQKGRRAKAYNTLAVTNTATALLELFELKGADIAPENLEEIRAQQTSFRENFGEELSGLGSTKDNLLNAISVAITNILADDDSDIDAAEVWADALLYNKGFNGPGASFMGDAKTYEQASKILSSLDGVADSRERKKTRERTERAAAVSSKIIADYGGKTNPELLDLFDDVASKKKGTEFENMDDADLATIQGTIDSLITSGAKRVNVRRDALAQNTKEFNADVSSGLYKSDEEATAALNALGDTLNIGDAYKHKNSYFEEVDDQVHESLRNFNSEAAVKDFLVAPLSSIKGVGHSVGVAFQGEGIDLRGSLDAEVKRAYVEGRPEDVPTILKEHEAKRDALHDRIKIVASQVSESKGAANGMRGKGDFKGALETLRKLEEERTMDPETYANISSRIWEEAALEDAAHTLGPGGGTLSHMVSRMREVVPTLTGTFAANFKGPEDPKGIFGTSPELWMDTLFVVMGNEATAYRAKERGNFESFAAYNAGLKEHLALKVTAVFTALGSEEEKFGAALVAQLNPDSPMDHLMKQMGYTRQGGAVTGPAAAPAAGAQGGTTAPTATVAPASVSTPIKLIPTSYPRAPFDDPLAGVRAGGASKPRTWLPPISIHSQRETAVYHEIAQVAPENQGKALVDLRKDDGSGFTHEEIMRGTAKVGHTPEQKERYKVNLKRALAYDGPRGWHPLEDFFGSTGTNLGHIFSFGAYMSDKEWNTLQTNIKSFYNSKTAATDIEVSIDMEHLKTSLNSTLVFADQRELNEFKSDKDHPYRAMFDILPAAEDAFFNNQQGLLESFNGSAMAGGRSGILAAEEAAMTQAASDAQGVAQDILDGMDAATDKVTKRQEYMAGQAEGKREADKEDAQGILDDLDASTDKVTKRQEYMAGQAEGKRGDEAAKRRDYMTRIATQKELDSLYDTFEAQDILSSLDNALGQAEKVKRRKERDRDKQKATALAKDPGMRELATKLSAIAGFETPESLRGFFVDSKRRRHVWTKDTKDDPGVIWDLIRKDKKRMNAYLKYLEKNK